MSNGRHDGLPQDYDFDNGDIALKTGHRQRDLSDGINALTSVSRVAQTNSPVPKHNQVTPVSGQFFGF